MARTKCQSLTILEIKRHKGDLIQMFKIIKDIDETNWFNKILFKNLKISKSKLKKFD